jgi:hypothetical protein
MSILDTQLRHSGPATPRLRVAWAAMLALTTLAALAVLVTTPFSAEEGEFIHALRSGEIQSVAVGHSADFYTASGVHTTGINVQDDIAVSWVNRFGFRREAVLDQLRGIARSILIAGFAISLVLLGIAWALPTYLDPVAWSAVDVAGNPTTP